MTPIIRKFRKKPVVIEAFRMIKERRTSYVDWPEWLRQAMQKDPQEPGSLYPTDLGKPDKGTLSVRTLNGSVVVSWGDWVIRGVEGELYPCKDVIFRSTYEPVNG